MFSCIECGSHSQREPCWIHAKYISDRKTTPLAVASLPDILYFEPSDALAGNGMLSDCKSVHTSVFIPAGTVFGPLLAPLFRSNTTSDDDNPDRSDLQCFQLDNDYFCNWLKYVRFASSREEQNLAVVLRGEDVVFVTTRSISSGEELKIFYAEESDDNSVSLQDDNFIGMHDDSRGHGDELAGNRFVTEEANALFTSAITDSSQLASWWQEAVAIRGAREYQLLPPDETLLPAGDIDSTGSAGGTSRTRRISRRSGYDSDVTYEECDDIQSESSSDISTCLRSGTKRKKNSRTKDINQRNGVADTVKQTDGEKRLRGRPRKLSTVEKPAEVPKNCEDLTRNPSGRPKKQQNADISEGSSKPPKSKRQSRKAKFVARMQAAKASIRMKAAEASMENLGEQKEKKLTKRPKKLVGADYEAYLYRIPCPECPLHFYSQDILSIHRFQHGIESEGTTIASEMKCIDCEHIAPDMVELSNHMDQHGMAVDTTLETIPPEHRSHPSCFLYACERGGCWKWFCTETQLKQHRLLHYPALPVDFNGLACPQCAYTAGCAVDLADHVTEHGRTPKDGFHCGICQRDVRLSMSDHMRHSHEDYYSKVSLDFAYQCSLCSVRFATEISRKKHACKNKRPQCYMCARQFPDFIKRNAHLSSHEINGKYPCPSCDFLSATAESVLAHIARAHDTSSDLVCRICRKVVKSSIRMNWHMKTHDNSMNFLCHQCGKRFNTSKYLKQHRHYMHGTEMRERIKRKLEEKRLRGEVPTRNTKGLRLEDYPFRCEECRVGFLREGPHARHMHEKHLVI